MKSLVAGIALVILSCTGSGPQGESPPEQIVIQNDNWQDAVVFVVTISGLTQRVGDVSAVQQEVLRVPADFAEGTVIRLLVELIGSTDSFITDQIIVSRSHVIFLRVSPYLSSSSWTIHDAGTEGSE